MFNLSSVYSACKSSNHKVYPNHKISPDTNLPIEIATQIMIIIMYHHYHYYFFQHITGGFSEQVIT